jgi:hypothetical protein
MGAHNYSEQGDMVSGEAGEWAVIVPYINCVRKERGNIGLKSNDEK